MSGPARGHQLADHLSPQSIRRSISRRRDWQLRSRHTAAMRLALCHAHDDLSDIPTFRAMLDRYCLCDYAGLSEAVGRARILRVVSALDPLTGAARYWRRRMLRDQSITERTLRATEIAPARVPEPYILFHDAVVARLRATVGLRRREEMLARHIVFVAPDDEDLKCGPDPDELGRPQDPARPTTAQLLLALRIAATLGGRDGVAACLESGSMTVISGLRADEVKEVAHVLRLALLPPGCRVLTAAVQAEKASRAAPSVLMVMPDVTRGLDMSRHDVKQFHERIADALDAPVPVVVLCPDEAAPQDELARYLPSTIQLASIGRDIVVQLLRATYRDVDESSVRAALPDDSVLSSLPPIALRASLRAPTALAAADRLGSCRAEKAAGPRLEDMTGNSPAVRAARQLVADLLLWRDKKLRWNELCRSLLLHGAPGTGKTWLARAMGASAGVAFIQASFAEWQSHGHLGDLLNAMRRTFAEARRKTPCILFLDEIDAVGSRLHNDKHSSYRTQVINGFLELMDSISREEGVIVVGACNYPDRIDPAVLREGRFDLKIEVPLPDAASIHGILSRHIGENFRDADLRDLARSAVGRSAAEVDGAVRRARAIARGEKRHLRLSDVRMLLVTDDDATAACEWRAAVHECGHAIVAHVIGPGVVKSVSLTRHGGETVRRAFARAGTLDDVEHEISCSLAGRAAEQLVFGDVSGGSGGPDGCDLSSATRLALAVDTQLGLGAWGPIWSDISTAAALQDPDTRTRVRSRILKAEAHAASILTKHRRRLEDMARALAHERLLTGESLHKWLLDKARNKSRAKINTQDNQPSIEV